MSDPTLSDIDFKIKWLGSELPLRGVRLPDGHFVRIPHGEDVPHFTWTSREFPILIIT